MSDAAHHAAEHVAVVCRKVWDERAPILIVAHDHAGDWQFLCGGLHHDGADEGIILHRGHVAERDPSVARVFDLAIGWEAERAAVGGEWAYFALPPPVEE
jgi:hypothetical protein